MNTRPSSSSNVVQFGSQEWLIQRAALPPTPASMTRPSDSSKMNVWYGLSGSLSGRCDAMSQLVTSPRYSMMVLPLRILRLAKTPRPWIVELRTE